MKPTASFYQVMISSELRTQGLRQEAFRGREQETKPVPYKDAVAALTFVATSDIPKRTLSSWGDLSKVQPNDSTR